MTFCTSFFLFGLVGLTIATVIPRADPITALSASQIAAFKPFSNYAATAYCQPAAVLNKSCGSEHQSLHSSVNTSLTIFKFTATQTPRSNPLQLVGMVCLYSFGMSVSTPASRYAYLLASNNYSAIAYDCRLLLLATKAQTPVKCDHASVPIPSIQLTSAQCTPANGRRFLPRPFKRDPLPRIEFIH